MSEPRIIDLDAARAARAEVAGEQAAPVIKFGGRDFRLPNEMPFEFAELCHDGKIRDGLVVLLNGQADDFFALQPTLGDIETLANGVAGLYGVDLGKSAASSSS